MKNKLPRQPYVLLALGLLLVTSGNFLSRKFGLPDFAVGFLLGMGIVMELVALCLIVRYRNGLKRR